MSAQMMLGTFDYREHFPDGTKIDKFYPPEPEHGSPPSPEFELFIREWHRKRSPFTPDGSVRRDPPLHPSTHMREAALIRKRLVPYFGGINVNAITLRVVKGFRDQLLAADLTVKSVRNIEGVLRKALNDAATEELLTDNPMRNLPRLRGKSRNTAAPLDPEEMALFLKTVDPYYRNYYYLAFAAGPRPSELTGLRWTGINFRTQQITFAYGRVRGHESSPKTGERTIACAYDPGIFEALRAQRAISQLRSEYVFIDKEGKPLNQDRLHEKVWLPTLRRCGISARGSYCTKDTFVSTALSLGEDPGWIAAVAGTSEQMIFSHYRKWLRTLTRQRDGSLIGKALVGVRRNTVPNSVPKPRGRRKKERKTGR